MSKYLLAIALFISFEISTMASVNFPQKQEYSLANLYEIEDSLDYSKQSIYMIVSTIVFIPPENRTFENTIRPWNELCEKLFFSVKLFSNFIERECYESDYAEDALEDLKEVLRKATKDTGLSALLEDFSSKLLHSNLNPLQKYIGERFFSQSVKEYEYFPGAF